MQESKLAGSATDDLAVREGVTVGSALSRSFAPGRRTSPAARAIDRLSRLPLGRVALAGAALIALVGGVGAIDALAGPLLEIRVFGVDTGSPFDLDGEWNLPALFSGALLLLAGWAGLALHAALPDRPARVRAAAIGLSAVLAFMAGDEVFGLHERLQKWSGVNWQALMLPVALIAAASWAAVVAVMRRARLPVGLLLGGAAAWLAAQGIEAAAWEPTAGYHVESTGEFIAEELLEMTGSLLLGLGLLAAAQHISRRRRPS